MYTIQAELKSDACMQAMQSAASQNLLLNDYDYVMHGRIFKFKEHAAALAKLEVYISFGGLLMQLVGDPLKLKELQIDENVFLLVRTV